MTVKQVAVSLNFVSRFDHFNANPQMIEHLNSPNLNFRIDTNNQQIVVANSGLEVERCNRAPLARLTVGKTVALEFGSANAYELQRLMPHTGQPVEKCFLEPLSRMFWSVHP